MSRGVEEVRGAITRSLGDRIDGIYYALEDVTSTPIRVFIAVTALNVVGVVLAAV
jgi:hypothetical protein